MDHTLLKIIQMHQYPTHQVQDAELYDDQDVLRQGGGDGGAPPGEDRFGPGPDIEPIHTDPADLPVPSELTDPVDVPVPDGESDVDLEDGDFWASWLDEIRADEFYFVEEIQKQKRYTHSWCPAQEAARLPRAATHTELAVNPWNSR